MEKDIWHMSGRERAKVERVKERGNEGGKENV